jgi:hypothetical protein
MIPAYNKEGEWNWGKESTGGGGEGRGGGGARGGGEARADARSCHFFPVTGRGVPRSFSSW